MFSTIDNVDGFVTCVYTGLVVATTTIPDGLVMNTEHTWPQSRGAREDPMKSDIHHLFPTDNGANSRRGNLEFCDVVGTIEWSEGGSEYGRDAASRTCFEPTANHRGDVARAMFHFAIVYEGQMDPLHPTPDDSITAWEEAVLRIWHAVDPPTPTERRRNAAVEAAQGSRNMFIDYPHLVGRIANF